MKSCDEIGCNQPAWGKDKKTRLSYCHSHQYLRTDIDRRSSYEKHMDKMGSKDESLSNLTDDLDAIFSKYIRLKYADSNGMVECFTSGKKFLWTQIQCGHFIPRGNLNTRWLVDNCRPQSEYDNCYLRGNLEVFARKLEAERPGIVEWLQEQGREVFKPSASDLKEMISDYRAKVKLLERKLINQE